MPADRAAPRERRGKASLACDSCHRRKSRCELLTAEGCRRCRVLGTSCSLGRSSNRTGEDEEGLEDGQVPYNAHASSSSTPLQSARASASPAIRTVQHGGGATGGWEGRDEEMTRISEHPAFKDLLSRAFLQSLQGRSSLRPEQTAARIQHELADMRTRSTGVSASVDMAIGLLMPDALPSPLEVGIASQYELKMAYTYFRSWLSGRSPIGDTLSGDLPIDEPLLASVSLYLWLVSSSPPYDSAGVVKVKSLLSSSLAKLSNARPSQTNIAALTGLSSMQCDTTASRLFGQVDAWNAIALAEKQMLRLGIDDCVWRLEDVGFEALRQPEYRALINTIVVAHGTDHRRRWCAMLDHPIFASPPSLLPPLHEKIPISTAQRLGFPTILHLVHESALFALFAPLSRMLQRIRTRSMPEPNFFDEMKEAYATFGDELSGWLTVVEAMPTRWSKNLRLQVLQLEMVVCFKISGELGPMMPSPLGYEARFPPMMFFAGRFYARARDVMDACLTWDLPLKSLPAFEVKLCLLAYAVVCHSANLDRVRDPALSASPEKEVLNDRLRQFRVVLCELHPSVDSQLKAVDESCPPSYWIPAVQEYRDQGLNDAAAALFGWDPSFDPLAFMDLDSLWT